MGRRVFIKLTSILQFSFLIAGCASNLNTDNSSTTTTSTNNQGADALIGALMKFQYSNFYSLTSPNPTTGCAGDANIYYDPISGSALATNTVDSTTTIRPSFISNVSVDLTDANAQFTDNNASACSLGNGPGAPPVSDCATFDYGAIDGIPSSLGGTLVMIGGVQSINYTGIQSTYTSHGLAMSCGPVYPLSLLSPPYGVNYCYSNMYAFGLNTLPPSAAGTSSAPGLASATSSISTWTNIANTTGYKGPRGSAGASAAYSPGLQELLLFGGAAPVSTTYPGGSGTLTSDTWIFKLATQSWTQVNANISLNSLTKTPDLPPASSTGPNQLSKGAGSRALFGYVALPGAGIQKFSTTGLVNGANGAGVDTTDRIIIVGGDGSSCPYSVCTDVHSLNPTFGPEYIDQFNALDPISTMTTSPLPVQWIDSYYMRVLSNSESTSILSPVFPAPSPTPSPSATPSIKNFAIAALNNNNPSSNGVGTTPYPPAPNSAPGAGYLVTAGGFYGYLNSEVNKPSGASCTSLSMCGGLQLFFKKI